MFKRLMAFLKRPKKRARPKGRRAYRLPSLAAASVGAFVLFLLVTSDKSVEQETARTVFIWLGIAVGVMVLLLVGVLTLTGVTSSKKMKKGLAGKLKGFRRSDKYYHKALWVLMWLGISYVVAFIVMPAVAGPILKSPWFWVLNGLIIAALMLNIRRRVYKRAVVAAACVALVNVAAFIIQPTVVTPLLEEPWYWILNGAFVAALTLLWVNPYPPHSAFAAVLSLVLLAYTVNTMAPQEIREILTAWSDEKEEGALSLSEKELRFLLTEPMVPDRLQEQKESGEIWDLRVLHSGIIKKDEWSSPVEVPLPPRGADFSYRVEFRSAGTFKMANRNTFAGTGRTASDFNVVSNRKNLELRFKSEEYERDGLVIWIWKQPFD